MSSWGAATPHRVRGLDCTRCGSARHAPRRVARAAIGGSSNTALLVCALRRLSDSATLAAQQSKCTDEQPVTRPQQHAIAVTKRQWLLAVFVSQAWRPGLVLADDIAPAIIRPQLAPDQGTYDPADPELRSAAALLQRALDAPSVGEEEALWSELVAVCRGSSANWAPDLLGRALGNRGNARSRQGKLSEALADYNAAIEACPWSVDPVLNRGVVLEALGRFDEAVHDYRAVLAAAPDDPAAWNNLGNATAGLGRWQEAAGYYQRAVALSPTFAFAAANHALALYQAGSRSQAIREFRSLLRRYPEFPDVRAALVAALWADGLEGDAEAAWERMEDLRYRDRAWLRTQRRWPPALVDALEAFLDLRSVPAAA